MSRTTTRLTALGALSVTTAAAPTTTPAATPAAAPATAVVTKDAKGVLTVTAAPGQSLTPSAPAKVGEKQILRLTGYKAGEKVTLVLHSTPRTLGTATADASGVVTFEFIAPRGTEAGDHTLKVTRADGSVVNYPVRIAAASGSGSDQLAYTGVDIEVPLIAGAALVALGGATVVATRRRKADGAQA